jgi:outer membrane protein TolC
VRRIEAEVDGAVVRANGARDAWSRLAAAAALLERSASLAARAYALGEGTVAEVLAARRLASDARLASAAALADAALARYRLLLDAHALWDLDAEE